uniref:PKD domain-containing protein n=1 Tax=Candidatus Methanogaster sp. ANME-2c ERB4 TaxID=2759911 RepID=A0A7G9YDG7_9EURY|nr:hypothetical protein DAFKAPGL_00003 [Methanosarcinales archaeon ANME-2c ERB4]QNO46051.1 hypothetical protein FINKGBGL_00001 [Methanosarcinales archaeon ANME-2c ERB4]
MPRKPLKHKPLIEAIFEFRWELQEQTPEMKVDPHYKILIDRMYDKISDEYPFHEQLPTATMPDEIAGYVKFPEVAYYEVETGVHDTTGVALKITDFQLLPTAELTEIASKVGDSRELINYRTVDRDYKGDTFHSQRQSFRVKRDPKVDYEAKHRYGGAGKYQIMVKVLNVFGNDTNKAVEVGVK